MKKNIYLCLILFATFFISCSSDDNPLLNYPKKVDIEFSINSTNKSLFSIVESRITSGTNQNGETDLDLTTYSHSNYHLPFKKIYVQQTVSHSTSLSLSYQDNSIREITDVFEPYTVELEIKVDGSIVANKNILIEENDQNVYLLYDFLE